MQELQFPSGFREVWWTPWIKFCLFLLRNWAMHCRMRKRRKEDETKRSINKLFVSFLPFSHSPSYSLTCTRLNVKARSVHVSKLIWNTGFVNTTVQSILVHILGCVTQVGSHIADCSCISCIFAINCNFLLKARWTLLDGSHALLHSMFHDYFTNMVRTTSVCSVAVQYKCKKQCLVLFHQACLKFHFIFIFIFI